MDTYFTSFNFLGDRFPDPSKFEGSDEEKLGKLREVKSEIKEKLEE